MKTPFLNRKSKGFTLIELLVVIAIILTLAGIAMTVVNLSLIHIYMKKITVMALAAFAASIMASCCCQDQSAPPLTPLPKFNDLNQPAVDVAPVVMKSKK